MSRGRHRDQECLHCEINDAIGLFCSLNGHDQSQPEVQRDILFDLAHVMHERINALPVATRLLAVTLVIGLISTNVEDYSIREMTPGDGESVQ